MISEKSTFDVSNLTEEEQAIRKQNIDSLFMELSQTNKELTRDEAEKLFDNMQQKAIEVGKSVWKFYKQN